MENIDITNATIPTVPAISTMPVQGSSVALRPAMPFALPFGGCTFGTLGSARLVITESARRGHLETEGHVGRKAFDQDVAAAFGIDAYVPGTTAWSPPI